MTDVYLPLEHYTNKILSSASFPVSHALSLPTSSIVHFVRRDIVRQFATKTGNWNNAGRNCVWHSISNQAV